MIWLVSFYNCCFQWFFNFTFLFSYFE